MAFSIPTQFEAYAFLRVVWYGGGDSVDVANLTETSVGNVTPFTKSFQKLTGMTTSDGGVELSTNGESDVASMSWNKDTTSPAGVLNLQLFPRRDYLNLISPEDVLIVYGKADKTSAERQIATLSVDAVTESRSVSEGATVVRISVQARDFGKVLMGTPTVYDPAFDGLISAQFYAEFSKAFTAGLIPGGPSLVVQTMLAVFFSLKQNFVTLSIGATVLPVNLDDHENPAFVPLLPWRFNRQDGLSLFQFIDTTSFVQKTMVGSLLFQPSVLQNAGNLWALCKMYSNDIVNEFFIDTRDKVPGYDDVTTLASSNAQKYLNNFGDVSEPQDTSLAQLQASMSPLTDVDQGALLNENATSDGVDSVVALVHRQFPYDTKAFYALPTSVVFETEVFTSNTGYSSADVRNMFRIRLPGRVENISQDLQYGVAINRESIKRHGLKLYEAESLYVYLTTSETSTKGVGSNVPAYDYYQSLILAWYAFNELLQSGSIQMRFRPDIRVGTRLTYVKTSSTGTLLITDYYVEQVQHSWSPKPNASRTTVNVVRGVNREDFNVVPYRESHLFWTDEGADLNPDPYEVVLSENEFRHGS